MSDSERSMPSTRSATRPWFWAVSAPMTAHWSAVDSSMLRKLVTAVMPRGYGGNPSRRLLRHRVVRIPTTALAGCLALVLLAGGCSDDDTPVTAGNEPAGDDSASGAPGGTVPDSVPDLVGTITSV